MVRRIGCRRRVGAVVVMAAIVLVVVALFLGDRRSDGPDAETSRQAIPSGDSTSSQAPSPPSPTPPSPRAPDSPTAPPSSSAPAPLPLPPPAGLVPSRDGNLIPFGFPTADTTGVPPEVSLEPVGGDMLIQTDGTIVDGMDVQGCLVVRANDVVIRNSRIRCGGSTTTPFPVRLIDGFAGLLIEDSEIDGLGQARVAVLGDNWTARRVDVHSSTDGLRMGSNTTVENSYVHDLSRLPETHNDTLQTIGGTNIRVLGNTLLAHNQRTDDPMNGAIQTGRLHSPLNGMLVEGNYLDGGSYTVRGGAGPRDGHLIADYVFRNNLVGRNCMYGPIDGVEAPVTWEPNNRWIDTGEVIGLDSRANKMGCRQTP